MPRGTKRYWRVFRDQTSGKHYVVNPGSKSAAYDDIEVDQFARPEEALDYADEANAIQSESQGESGETAAVPLGGSGEVVGTDNSGRGGNEGQAQAGQQKLPLPAMQLPATPGAAVQEGRSIQLSGELFGGRPVELLPQEIADKVDEAGVNYDNLKAAVAANLSRILGNCRQGIGKCTTAVDAAISPAVEEAKERLQFLKETVAQHASNVLMAAMTNAAVIRGAAGLPYSYPQTESGRTLSGTGPAVDTSQQIPGTMAATLAPPGSPTVNLNPPAFIPGQHYWTAWYSVHNKNCYCREAGEAPQDPNDQLVSHTTTFDECRNAVAAFCAAGQPPPQQPPPLPIQTLPPTVPNPIGTSPGIQPTYPTSPPPGGGWFIGGGGYYYYANPIQNNPGFCCPPGYVLATLPNGFQECLPGPNAPYIPGLGGGASAMIPCGQGGNYYGPFPGPNFTSQPLPPPTTSPPPPPTVPPTVSPPPPQCPPSNIYVSCPPGQTPYVSPTGPPPIGPPPIGQPPPPIGGTITTQTPGSPPVPVPVVNIDPLEPVSSTGDYCDNLSAVRRQFIAIGNRALKDGVIRHDLMFALIDSVANISYLAAEPVKVLLRSLEQDSNFKKIVGVMRSVVTTYHGALADDYIALLACRRIFEMMESYGIDGGSNAVGDSTRSLSATPSIFGIGGGWSGQANYAGTESLKISVKAFIIPLVKTLDRCIAWTCTEEIPGIQESVSLYLGNAITLEHCQCLVGLNGGVWDEFAPSIQANRAKLDGLQSVVLWMRGKITKHDLDTKVREIGFVRDTDVQDLIELAKFIPGPSDLIRFMVRDVEDRTVVEPFELDAEFDRKYVGLVQEQGKAQGLDVDTAKRYWRAHWDWPSATQLYEMLHRLRPDNRPAGRTEKDWDVGAALVEKVLGINDVIPAFRKRLVDISYRPLTRIDARRAYNIGALSDAEMLSAIKDQGYGPENADRLLRFAKLLRDQSVRGNKYVKQYIAGGINAEQLADRLKADGIPDELAQRAREYADKELQTAGRLACVKALRRRFQLGEFTRPEVEQALLAAGMSDDQAKAFSQAFDCERMSRAKQLSAAALCKYVEHGLIQIKDMGERLLRFGYSPEDASLIIQECGINVAQRQAHAAEQLAKKAAADQEKIAKAREKLLKDLQNAKQKQLKAAESAQKARDKRQSAFTRAAIKAANIRGISAADSAAEMESAVIHGVNTGGITDEEAVQLSIDVANSWKAREGRPFAVVYDDALRAYRDSISLEHTNGMVE